MKIRILLPWVFLSVALVVIILTFFTVKNLYSQKYEEYLYNIEQSYVEAVCKETTFRLQENNIPYFLKYKSNISPSDSLTIRKQDFRYKVKKTSYYDSFTIEEQALLEAFQTYLFSKNIFVNLSRLDSLTAGSLQEKGLEIKFASKYEDHVNKMIDWSQKDSSIYIEGQALSPLLLGDEQELSLQLYIIFSYKDILLGSASDAFLPHLIGLILAVIMLVFSTIWIIWGRQLSKYSVFAPLMGAEPAPVEVVPNERPVQEKYLITEMIYLDVDRQKIMGFDGRTVILSKYMRDLMKAFLHANERYLTYKEIYVALWDDVDIDYNERLSQLVRRLRQKLEIFPELSIENQSGNGYQLLIHSVDEPPPGNPQTPAPIKEGDK